MNDGGSGDMLWRFAGERLAGQQRSRQGAQHIPVNVFETDEDVVIVAPMPGVEPDDIEIEVLGTRVSLRAAMRGPGQENRRYVLREWSYGPYERTLELPVSVDAERANASHSNGVLALTLPKSTRSRSVRVPLKQTGSSDGVREGHSGHHTTRDGLGKEGM